MRWAWTAILLALATGPLGGCQDKSQSASSKLNAWIQQVQPPGPAGLYTVQPPDVITISAPAIKELDKRTAALGPDGRISLNLVGEIYVAGKTTDEIAADLARLMKRYYDAQALDIVVQVKEYRSKFISVFGQVGAPGIKPYTGGDTVLKVLGEARFLDSSWPEKVVIVRPNEDPQVRHRVTINVKEMYESGRIDQNYLLEAGDLVFVPRNPLSQLGLTFSQMLIPLRPVTTLAGLAAGV